MRCFAKCLLTALPTQRLATALAENYGLFFWMPEAIHISQVIEQAAQQTMDGLFCSLSCFRGQTYLGHNVVSSIVLALSWEPVAPGQRRLARYEPDENSGPPRRRRCGIFVEPGPKRFFKLRQERHLPHICSQNMPPRWGWRFYWFWFLQRCRS
jgi:hypothetical protein